MSFFKQNIFRNQIRIKNNEIYSGDLNFIDSEVPGQENPKLELIVPNCLCIHRLTPFLI